MNLNKIMMKFVQLTLTVLFLISTYLVTVSIAARFGGGFRGGVRTGSRTGSGYRSVPYRSGIRTVSSRYTSSNGYNSANRFTSTNGVYRYGAYSGNRFGTQIRRTTYWPVAFLFLSRPYRYNSIRPTQNSNEVVNSSVVISDQYTKRESTNASLSYVYYCVNSVGVPVETCYESIDTDGLYSQTVEEEDANFEFEDGACCEDGSGSALCCIVQLNKALALKGIMVTLFSLVFTSSILVIKICR